MEQYYLYGLIFVLGLAIGSFLNVLIYRLPREKKFTLGRSFCPSCEARIKFYDNIPIISYLILRGKCRRCKAKISIRYPLVELINALVYIFLLWNYDLTPQFYVYAVLSSALIVIFFIDLEFQIIPDVLTLPGMALGLAVSFIPGGIGIVSSIIGLLAGGGILYLVAVFGDKLFKKESMGGGDIKMAAMLGAFLGWQKVILIFLGGSLIGLVISIIVMSFSKKIRSSRIIPFGPFLAITAFIAIVYGDSIIEFYINHFFIS